MDEPNEVLLPWPELYLGTYDYIPTVIRSPSANEVIPTIMQFPVMAIGMENCSIVLDVPSKATDPGEDEAVVTFGPGRSTEVDVWFLDTCKKFDFNHFSRNNTSRRPKHISAFSMSYGHSQGLLGFHCPSGSFNS